MRLFIYLFFGFVFATIAGTLSHECGHWVVGKYYGSNPRIGYKYTTSGDGSIDYQRFMAIHDQYAYEIHNKLDFPSKEEYEKLKPKINKQHLLFTAGGPMETVFTGTLGLLLLFLFRKKFAGKERLSFVQWFMVFLSLFWLREIFNLVIALVQSLAGREKFNGDEFKLARDLNWNLWSVSIATGLASLVVLGFVTFKFIPLKQRFTFIIAGFTGGVTGAYVWLILLGPRLMP